MNNNRQKYSIKYFGLKLRIVVNWPLIDPEEEYFITDHHEQNREQSNYIEARNNSSKGHGDNDNRQNISIAFFNRVFIIGIELQVTFLGGLTGLPAPAAFIPNPPEELQNRHQEHIKYWYHNVDAQSQSNHHTDFQIPVRGYIFIGTVQKKKIPGFSSILILQLEQNYHKSHVHNQHERSLHDVAVQL